MRITLDVPDGDVDGLSAAWEDRVARNDGESAADHLTRAYTETLAPELKAARVGVAGDAVDAATTDDERKTALLAKYYARRAR